MSSLPSELIDYILSSLRLPKDKDALCACSLVCAAWLPIVREHLFETLRTKAGPAQITRSLSDFVRVSGNSSGVAHAVRTLVVDGFQGDSKLLFTDLVSLLQQLPRLQNLLLNNLRIPDTIDMVQCGYSPRTLRSLEMNNVGFYLDNPTNIFKLLHLFRNIGELQIERLWFRYAYGAPRNEIIPMLPIPTHLSITTLTLYCADERTELMLDSLLHTCVPDTLRNLTISFYDFTPLVPSLSRFLADPRCHIHRLALDFCRGFPYEFWSDKRMLAEGRSTMEQVLKPALQSLTLLRVFALYTGNIPEDVSAFWDMCLAVLDGLPEGVMEIHMHVVNNQFGFDLPLLVKRLQQYERLVSVVVHGLCGGESLDKAKEELGRIGKGVQFVD